MPGLRVQEYGHPYVGNEHVGALPADDRVGYCIHRYNFLPQVAQ